MDTIFIVTAISGMIGGTSYFLAWFLKQKGERELLKNVAFACHQRISRGIEVTWDDLQEMYVAETKAAVGTSGYLETPEDHQIVDLLDEICSTYPIQNPQAERLLLNLKRTLPQDCYFFVGRNYIANAGALFLMMSMFGLLPLLGGKLPARDAKWPIIGCIMLCSLICLVAAIITIRVYIRARRSRRLHERKVQALQ
jgi:hypothetical protein